MLTDKHLADINRFVQDNYEYIDCNYIDDTNILYSALNYGDIVELSGKRTQEYRLINKNFLPDDGKYIFLMRQPTMMSDSFSLRYCKISAFFGMHPYDDDVNNLFFDLPFDLYNYYDSVKFYRFTPKNKVIGFMGAMQSGKTASARITREILEQNAVNIISFANPLRSVCLSILRFIKIDGVGYGTSLTIDDLKNDDIKKRKLLKLCHDQRKNSRFDSVEFYNKLIQKPPKFLSRYPECANINPQDIYNAFLQYLYELERKIDDSQNFTIRNLLQTFGTDFVRNHINTDFWTNRTKSIIMYGLLNDPDQNICYIIDDVRFENEADFVKSMGGIVIGVKRGAGTRFGSHPSERTMAESWSTMASVTIHNDGDLDDLRRNINETLTKLPGFIGA